MQRAAPLLCACVLACGESIGDEGTQFPQPLTSLSGGIIFSTSVIEGGNGYNLYWADVRGSTPGSPQPFLPLTTSGGDEVQPSISPSGQALVFASRGNGIFFVDAAGAVTRISDTRGTSFLDSLPAVNLDGDRVAWVREDTDRPIGQTGFATAEVWVANADGTEARAVNPKPDVVQDAPAFEPMPRSTRLAWSEFNAATLGANGPNDYGVWMHDLGAFSGRFVCRGAYEDPNAGVLRCFGQHLAWPERDRLVLGQQLMEIDPTLGPTGSRLPELLNGLASATGAVDRTASPFGFFPRFPLSTSFAGTLMVVDGLFTPFQGDVPTLAFFVAGADASSPFRLEVSGHQADFDELNTAGYLLSLATPQLVP